MSLPSLLRRLAQSAHDRNERDVGDVLAQLARHSGWSNDVHAFVKRMPSRDRSYVSRYLTPRVKSDPGWVDAVRSKPSNAGGPMAGVARDSTSGKYVPANASQWAEALAQAGITSGGPHGTWLMQEPSGTLADSIGASTLSVTSMTYANAVSGWTRTAMGATDAGANNVLFNSTDTNLPDQTATSALMIGYIAIGATPAADRGVMLNGGVRGIVTSTNVPKASNATNTATGASSVTTVVRPWVIRHNLTLTTQSVFTDLEKVTPTYAAPVATKRVYFGGLLETCPTIRVLYGAAFKGAAAELTDAQLRTLLTRLGWTIAW
jgi:hypothetical protein